MSKLIVDGKADLTVVVPVHVYDEQVERKLPTALESVKDLQAVIISPKNVAESVEKLLGDKFPTASVKVAENENKVGFQTLVNEGVKYVQTTWFTILEFDDYFTETWLAAADAYMEDYDGYSVYLPIEEVRDYDKNSFISYGNEAPWASSFSNELGVIDNDCLQEFFDFYMTGGIFNLEDFNKIGGLKESMKLSFWYEFLLRLTNNGKNVYVVPKLGYMHYLNRKGSLLDIYATTMTQKESEWWFDLAKQECFHKADRGKQYDPEEEDDDEE